MNRLPALALFALILLLSSTSKAEDRPSASSPGARGHFLLGGGLSYGGLFAIGMRTTTIETGGVLDLSRHHAVTVGGDLNLGKTDIGDLPVHAIGLSTTVDAVVGRFRFGIGPRASYFWLSRATSSATIDTLGIGLRGRVSVDLLRLNEAGSRGIYFSVSPDVELLALLHPIWRAGAMIGLRF
jgi:hypothetical protein